MYDYCVMVEIDSDVMDVMEPVTCSNVSVT